MRCPQLPFVCRNLSKQDSPRIFKWKENEGGIKGKKREGQTIIIFVPNQYTTWIQNI